MKKMNLSRISILTLIMLVLFAVIYISINNNESYVSETNPPGRIIFRATINQSNISRTYYIMDGNGGRLQFLGNFTGSAVWSHDGKFIAVGCKDDLGSICIYDSGIIGANRKYPFTLEDIKPNSGLVRKLQITAACQEAVAKDPVGIRLSWSADGQSITTICNSASYTKVDKNLICTYDLNASSVCWVGTQKGLGSLGTIQYATRSPISNDLAVSGYYDPDNDKENDIYLTDANGNNPRLLTKGWAPAWSRDGKQIAFFRKVESKFTSMGIGVINADGQNFHWLFPTPQIEAQLSKIDYVQGIYDRTLEFTDISFSRCADYGDRCSLTWSPDGQYILFTGTYLNVYITKLFRLNIRTGEILMPLDVSRWVLDPDWGPY